MRQTRILVSGIGASGRLGANSGEKDEPQEVVVDLDVTVSVGGDDLAATADYRALIATARAAVAGAAPDLLETLAHLVAGAVAASPGVVRATATVHKPAAARSNDVGDVAASATAEG